MRPISSGISHRSPRSRHFPNGGAGLERFEVWRFVLFVSALLIDAVADLIPAQPGWVAEISIEPPDQRPERLGGGEAH
jgi:hypothetical protein